MSDPTGSADGLHADPCNCTDRCARFIDDMTRCVGYLARSGDIVTANAKRAPWSSNPWVWAITFERIVGDQP